MIKVIEKFKWPLTVMLIAMVALYVVVVGFGEALGVNETVRIQISNVLWQAWAGVMTLLAAIWAKDSDGDGVPDVVDDTPNGEDDPSAL